MVRNSNATSVLVSYTWKNKTPNLFLSTKNDEIIQTIYYLENFFSYIYVSNKYTALQYRSYDLTHIFTSKSVISKSNIRLIRLIHNGETRRMADYTARITALQSAFQGSIFRLFFLSRIPREITAVTVKYLGAFCREQPAYRGGRLRSSADSAGNICHMAQLRIHETTYARTHFQCIFQYIDRIFSYVSLDRRNRKWKSGKTSQTKQYLSSRELSIAELLRCA